MGKGIDIYNPVLWDLSFCNPYKSPIKFESHLDLFQRVGIDYPEPYGFFKTATITEKMEGICTISLTFECPWGDATGNIVRKFSGAFFDELKTGTIVRIVWGYYGYKGQGFAYGNITTMPEMSFGSFCTFTFATTGSVSLSIPGAFQGLLTGKDSQEKEKSPEQMMNEEMMSEKFDDKRTAGTTWKETIAKIMDVCKFKEIEYAPPSIEGEIDSWTFGMCPIDDPSTIPAYELLNSLARQNKCNVSVLSSKSLESGIECMRLVISKLETEPPAKKSKYTFGICLIVHLLQMLMRIII
jgi:hypothetical protein